MEIKVLKFKDMRKEGETFMNMFSQRREVFVESFGWNIPEDGEIEMDQYDGVNSVYFILQNEKNECLGSIRALPTKNKNGPVTYMIKDAVEERIQGIPSSILPGPAPVDEEVWEITRLVVSPHFPARDRKEAHKKILKGLVDFGRNKGIKEYLFIASPALLKIFRNFGYEVDEKGIKVHIDGKMNTVGSLHIN